MKKYFYILAVVLAFATPSKVFSQTNSAIKTLRGFDTLKVEVEPLAPDLEKAGITKEQIQTDVETKLRRAGFKVKKPNETVAPYVMLHVNVNSIDNGVGGFAVSVTSSINQFVILDRDKSISSLATTWESKSIVSVIKEKVQGIRNFINLQMDIFINSHLKANASTQKQSTNLPPAYTTPPLVPTTKKGRKNAKLS
ncbi:hypothetical protein BH24ACI2_BH24ACI2_01360 [soil metagenome]|jgi:hypothetical protein